MLMRSFISGILKFFGFLAVLILVLGGGLSVFCGLVGGGGGFLLGGLTMGAIGVWLMFLPGRTADGDRKP